jgi:ATP-dependent RNA/DNA helicase IGHMBP2
MERAMAVCGRDNVSCMLTQQYRMHKVIMTWASENLYDNQLTADKSVECHLLRDLPDVANTPNTSIPLLLIDTAGCDRLELETSEDSSKGNEGEADIVGSHVGSLIEAGVQPSSIAVITPYNLQVEMIRNRLMKYCPVLEISSVDGFQGREKEAIILSLVRSNKKREVGFLSDYRRINVAVTRARRHLAVVADSDTVCCNEFIRKLIDYMGCHGEVRSAVEYDDIQTVVSAVSASVESMGIDHDQGFSIINTDVYQTERSVPQKQEAVIDGTSLEETQRNPPNKAAHNQFIDADQLATTLEEFLASESTEFAFHPALSAQERYLVHEAAEKYQLTHYSKGNGKHRQVVVKKKVKSETAGAEEASNQEIPYQLVSVESQAVIKEQPTRKCCPHCNQWVPLANVIIHEARCARAKTAIRPQMKHLVKPLSGAKGSTKSQKDDDQLLLLKAAGTTNRCSYGNCKELVSLTGQLCKFCRFVYCLMHFIPEVHGCGDDAKKEARNSARKAVQNTPGCRSASQNQQFQRLHLKQKLDDQLENLKRKRTGKQRPN